jgi:hypothetical protein
MMAFIREAVKAGVLVATEGFGPSAPSDARIRQTNGKFSVTDGPFTEAKELIGGFAILRTRTRDEAIDWTRRFLEIGGDGEAELHQLVDLSPIEMAHNQ